MPSYIGKVIVEPSARGDRGTGKRDGEGPGSVDPRLESSAALIERARSGDRDALEQLCERYLPRLRRWARGRLPAWARDLLETDDLVSATMAEAARRIEVFEPRWEGAFQAFLREALRNRIRDEIRRVRRKAPMLAVDGGEVDPGPSPLDEAVGREAVDRYEGALQKLRGEEREAIVARVELGCSYQEVADALGKATPDAARMAVGRALVRLAEAMGRGA